MELIKKAILSAYNKLKLKHYEDVEEICDQIIKVDPNNLESLYLSAVSKYKLNRDCFEIINQIKKINSYESNNYLGLFYLQIENIQKSIKYFTNAIEINPKLSNAWSNLGCQFRAINKTNLAIECFKKAKKIDCNKENILINLAGAYADNLEIDKSIKILSKVIKINPKNHCAHVDLSYAYFLLNKYRKAYPHYQHRFDHFESLSNKINKNKRWKGEKIKDGKKILFFTEQGIGDSINFIRFVKQFIEKYPKVQVQTLIPKELSCLFNISNTTNEIEDHDYNCSVIDIPYYLGFDEKQIKNKYKPYVSINKKCDYSKFKDNYKIGICWAGNPQHTRDSDRSCHLSLFEEIYKIPNIKLFSLQKDLRKRKWPFNKKEIDLAYSKNIKMIDMSKYMTTWEETASIINGLDLVISVDTSILHLSGAMGKKTYGMISYFPDWRWGLRGEKNIWYPSLTLFRQKEKGNWKSVIEEIKIKINKDINNI